MKETSNIKNRLNESKKIAEQTDIIQKIQVWLLFLILLLILFK